MFHNDCMECEKKSFIVEEKQKEILILQQNMFELKTKMIDANTLMNAWITYKKENENLKKELNFFRSNKTVSSEDQSILKYNFELLQNKYDQICKQFDLEKYKNAQFSAACDDIMGSKELRVELIKLRKQISEKDKEISELHRIKSSLEKQRKIESVQIKKTSMNEQSEKEEFFQKCQEDEIKRNNDEVLNVDFRIHPTNEQNFKKLSEKSILPDFSFKELIEENEFLKLKYQKYNSKYIKFKAKYSETKNFLEVLLQRNILPEYSKNVEERPKSVISVQMEKEISFGLLKNKRKNMNTSDSEDKSKNSQEKNKRKRGKKENDKKEKNQINIMQEMEENEMKERNKKAKKVKKTDIEKKLEKITARKEKIKTRRSPAVSTSNTIEENGDKKSSLVEAGNKRRQIKKIIFCFANKIYFQVENAQKEFKLPLRRTRTKKGNLEDIFTSNQIKKETFLTILSSDTSDLKSKYEDYICNFLGNLPEYESTTQILELILLNYLPQKIDRIIYLYVIYIVQIKERKLKTFNLFVCLKDFLMSNLQNITGNTRELINKENDLNQNIIEKILECFNDNLILNKESLLFLMNRYNSSEHLIGYLLIFTVLIEHEYIFEYYKLAKELLFDSMFDFQDTISLSSIILKQLYDNKYIKPLNKVNTMNKIYILNQLSREFMDESIINFINEYITIQINCKKIKLPEDIIVESISEELFENDMINFIIDRLKHLDVYVLREENNDKLNLGENTVILEVYQLILILMKIRSIDWIKDVLIKTILFNEFISCSKGSLKRIVIIYLVGTLINFLFVAHNYQLVPLKIFLSWIYSILDPQFNVEVITVYDEITALAFMIEFVRVEPNIFEMVKKSVNNLLKNHDKELFPMDLKEKLIRTGIVDKLEFR